MQGSDFIGTPIVGSFYEKELQRTTQEKFRVEKVMKRKADKLYVKWKGYDNSLNINVNIDLSNYETKTDLKNVTHSDTSSFSLKTNLTSLKTEVHKLDIDKLVPVPVDFSKLSDAVKSDVVKKTVYDKLAAKVNYIDTSKLVLKTKYQTEKTELEKKNS